MTLARIAVTVVLGALLVVLALVLFGGSGGMHYSMILQNSGHLVPDNAIQIGGRRVGRVDAVSLTTNNQVKVDFTLSDEFAPLHEGTRAVVRGLSLPGVANHYIALTPGPSNAPDLEEGATLDLIDTNSAVDLDQLFNTLDPKTREGLTKLVRGFGEQYAGKGKKANLSAKYMAPSLSATADLAAALAADQTAFEQFVVSTAGLTQTLADKSSTVTELVSNAAQTAEAIASENAGLSQTLSAAPPALRQGSTTLVNLREAVNDLDELVNASKPATKNLAPFLKRLRPLLRNSNPTLKSLAKAFGQPGANNDLAEGLLAAPKAAKAAAPASRNTIAALEKATPVLKFLRPYTPDLVGWIRDFGQSTTNYDANGHYARIQPVFDGFDLDSATNTMTPQPPSERLKDFVHGKVARCPGAASQATADGSAPFRDTDGQLDCDATAVLP
jgi:phospholipid/cholesterol/gamma-HCH transport system substrate-binding protein